MYYLIPKFKTMHTFSIFIFFPQSLNVVFGCVYLLYKPNSTKRKDSVISHIIIFAGILKIWIKEQRKSRLALIGYSCLLSGYFISAVKIADSLQTIQAALYVPPGIPDSWITHFMIKLAHSF